MRPFCFLRTRSRSILTILAFFLLLRGFALEPFSIPTSSMEETLLVGDFLLVNKALFGARIPFTQRRIPAFREPCRGEVIVFRPPHDSERSYVKRLVGTPGDTLEMRGKTLFVNGQTQEETFVAFRDRGGDAIHPDMAWQSDFLAAAAPGQYTPSRDNWGPLIVPEGKYFVLGDNRDNSEDSRYWGFVSRESVIGTPWIVYFSIEARGAGQIGWRDRIRWDRAGRRIR